MSRAVLPAQTATAIALDPDDGIAIINVPGTQVVDAWAIVPPSADEHLSMEHTRASLAKLVPRVGDHLYSNHRRPLAVLAVDTSPGVHDTLIAACDPERYRLLGASEEHANCAENYRRALAEIGMEVTHVPAPLNLFMNIPWSDDGSLQFRPTVARPGDYVVLKALTEIVVVLSACPMDVNAINGHCSSDQPASRRRRHQPRGSCRDAGSEAATTGALGAPPVSGVGGLPPQLDLESTTSPTSPAVRSTPCSRSWTS